MAQRSEKYDAYITKFSEFAIECQNEHRIPASITLAQGLLESAAGESDLARDCNNHFGIKCGSDWYGRSMRKDDDARNECFRCYRSAKESFDDHAKFLKRQRYAFLFQYDILDYKSWAYGLKQAGYATDPKYPAKLIKIIETYELYEYDKLGGRKNGQTVKNEKQGREELLRADKLFDYVIIKNNGRKCIKLLTDDHFENIAKAQFTNVEQLLYYNDLPKEIDLKRGDYVYLERKKGESDSYAKYLVKPGDSMHSIAQEFGIRLRALYKMNGLKYGTPVKTGQILKLKK